MSKHSATPARRVWRITADSPQGEYVDSRADEGKRAEPRPRPESDVPDTNWMTSSIDLAQGLDVIDRTDIPSESFDRWFGR